MALDTWLKKLIREGFPIHQKEPKAKNADSFLYGLNIANEKFTSTNEDPGPWLWSNLTMLCVNQGDPVGREILEKIDPDQYKSSVVILLKEAFRSIFPDLSEVEHLGVYEEGSLETPLEEDSFR